ncbi:MAG TPA: hypothetical protein VK113_01740, partial [Gemmatimonadales bacterium]|nr:hypothetical protein [Gemmatimonadales bacterium]
MTIIWISKGWALDGTGVQQQFWTELVPLLPFYDTESRYILSPVKPEAGPKRVPLANRLAVLLDV